MLPRAAFWHNFRLCVRMSEVGRLEVLRYSQLGNLRYDCVNGRLGRVGATARRQQRQHGNKIPFHIASR